MRGDGWVGGAVLATIVVGCGGLDESGDTDPITFGHWVLRSVEGQPGCARPAAHARLRPELGNEETSIAAGGFDGRSAVTV